jgi:hypothetical protein
MTEQMLDFDAPARETLTDKMAANFKQWPNRWLDVLELAEIGGIGGWRSRLAELRFPPFSMNIENRQVRWPDGRRRSQYRFIPAGEARSGAIMNGARAC